MQADRPDEIDRIIGVEVDRILAEYRQYLVWELGNSTTMTFEEVRTKSARLSELRKGSIRAALKAAGFAIQLDETQLLEKGEKLFKPVRSA